MPRDKKRSDTPEGAPMWVVTFSDLMSLLLTFFVLLLSFSTISEEKFNEAAASLRGAFSILPKQLSFIAPEQPANKKDSQEAEQTNKEIMERMSAARQLQRSLQVEGQEKKVKVEMDALGGLKLNLPSAALFETGSATLKADAFLLLRELGAMIKEIPEAFVEVRGHTDNQPVTRNAQFRDNRDLSYHRAYTIVGFLVDVSGLPGGQFEVHALGQHQPLVGNDTEEGRAVNRRVELFVRGPVDQSKMAPFLKRIEDVYGVEAPGIFPLSPGGFN